MMGKWRDISTVDKSLESVDLFGFIAYDCTETRLTDCELIDGVWHYFCGGEMLSVEGISFTPTHWMPIPEDPE